MMNNDRGCRLLRGQLKLFGQLDTDPFGLKQFEDLGLVFEIRACRITEAKPRTLIALVKEFGKFRSIATGYSEFFANSFMPHLGKGLSGFDGQSVEQQIVGVVI